MERYWIITEIAPLGAAEGGVGITAHSTADALVIFADAFGPDYVVREARVIRDMRELPEHMRYANAGNHFVRGVWYPCAGTPLPDYRSYDPPPDLVGEPLSLSRRARLRRALAQLFRAARGARRPA